MIKCGLNTTAFYKVFRIKLAHGNIERCQINILLYTLFLWYFYLDWINFYVYYAFKPVSSAPSSLLVTKTGLTSPSHVTLYLKYPVFT